MYRYKTNNVTVQSRLSYHAANLWTNEVSSFAPRRASSPHGGRFLVDSGTSEAPKINLAFAQSWHLPRYWSTLRKVNISYPKHHIVLIRNLILWMSGQTGLVNINEWLIWMIVCTNKKYVGRQLNPRTEVWQKRFLIEIVEILIYVYS